jgi:hypothetical protein
MNKKYTFEEAMNSFKQRSQVAQQILRRIASQRLVNSGAEEVGSSDINHELVSMCNEFGGDWDEVYLWAVNESGIFED